MILNLCFCDTEFLTKQLNKNNSESDSNDLKSNLDCLGLLNMSNDDMNCSFDDLFLC